MIENRLLHALARVAVRAQRPLVAKRLLARLGKLLPPISLQEAGRWEVAMEGEGTCLTRALAIAARLPSAEVVIGTDGPSQSSFSAHAWVEQDGEVVAGAPRSRHEIARLK